MGNIPTTDNPLDLTGRPARNDGASRGRRLTWEEFEKITGRKAPANNNSPKEEKAA